MRALLRITTGGSIARKLQVAIVAFPIVASPLFAVPAYAAGTDVSGTGSNNGTVCAVKAPKFPSVDLCTPLPKPPPPYTN